MHKLLLATAAVTGLLAVTVVSASAAPGAAVVGVHTPAKHSLITNIDYEWHHHHYHHRRWEHDHWVYWD